jgi:RHS repeat-associated protein
VTAVGNDLYIESIATGSASNYPYFLSATNVNPTLFPEPSFVSSSIGGQLDGGANQNSGSGSTIYSFTGSYDGVGNLTSYTDNGSGGKANGIMGTWSFTYDTLNRLATATVAANAPAPYAGKYGCWAYDSFGNRTVQSLQSSSCPAQSAFTWVYGANNRVTGVIPPGGTQPSPSPLTYDQAGNVQIDTGAGNQYLYDGEGRICAVSSPSGLGGNVMTGYIYDADGTRVAKGRISAWSCDPAANGFQTTNDYILGPGGQQVTEMAMDANNSMAWQYTNVYAAGSLIATYDNDGLHFYFNDPLGTRRAQTNYAGVLEQTCSSLPFGDGLSCSGGNLQAPTEHHFTGKERDAESGNDYFMARYYSSAMGRFLSPDWSAKAEPVPYAKLDDPQTLNLYAYVLNNPLTRTDPDGHFEAQWHFAITLTAGLMTGHGVIGSTKLAYQATMVDFRRGSQKSDAAHTNMHAMEGRKSNEKLQNATEARQGTHDVVSNAMKSGDTGLALHAVQDLAVPLHDGHAWTGVDGSFVKHFIGDNFPSLKTVGNALNNSIDVLQGKNPVQVPAPTPPPPTPDPKME